MSFDEINLTRKELSRLKKLNKQSGWIPSDKCETQLLELRLIDHQLCYENGVSIGFHSWITSKGKDYLAYLKKKSRHDRRESTRFFISTVLALLALIIAVAALLIDLWQLGLL